MLPLHRLFTYLLILAIVISFIFEMISRQSHKPKIHTFSLIVLIGGILIVVPCILTGFHEGKLVFTIDPVHEVMLWHRGLALVLVGVMMGLAVWGVLKKGLIYQTPATKEDPPYIPPYYRRGEGKVTSPKFLIVLLVVVILMGVTGYLGEKMVHKYGAGKPLPATVGISNWGIQASRGYRCPVHRNLTSAYPGLCPKCGIRMIPIMDLPSPKQVKQKTEAKNPK
jgi:uncharacterized membrane protein